MTIRIFKTDVYIGFGAIVLFLIFGLWGSSAISSVLGIGVFVIAAFLSVLTHEFAHVFAARAVGVKCNNITVFVLGMAAHLENTGKRPRDMLFISVVGPLTSLALAALFYTSLLALQLSGVVLSIVTLLALLNFVVGVFNILPLFPLDGGRLAHSIAWAVTKNKLRGIRFAVYTSRTLIISLLVLLAFNRSFMGILWPLLIAWFLWSAGTMELEHVVSKEEQEEQEE